MKGLQGLKFITSAHAQYQYSLGFHEDPVLKSDALTIDLDQATSSALVITVVELTLIYV